MASAFPALKTALIARPQWDWSSPIGAGDDHSPAITLSPSIQQEGTPDSRLVNAPLQHLSLCTPDRMMLDRFRWSQQQWLVLTSPASVQALDQWLFHTGINVMFNPDMRVAAVGSGTKAQLVHYIAQNAADPARAWRINAARTITSAIDEKADAVGLLAAMDEVCLRDGFYWQEQVVLIAQGQNSRTTLVHGLRERGATVLAANLYRRIDVSWPDTTWDMLAAAAPQEVAVVVTSTTVVDRLLQEYQAHELALTHVVWATQHAAIAERLRLRGIQTIRRVHLDASHLAGDLFEHEQYW